MKCLHPAIHSIISILSLHAVTNEPYMHGTRIALSFKWNSVEFTTNKSNSVLVSLVVADDENAVQYV